MESIEENEILAIISKYEDQEANINGQLQISVENKIKEDTEYKKIKRQNRLECMEKAIDRNKKILKDFEIIKSTLRSKAIYSPSEMQWDAICRKYKASPSLPITSWRCHLPVFV